MDQDIEYLSRKLSDKDASFADGEDENDDVIYVKIVAPILLLIYLTISFATNHRNIFAGACCSRHKGTFFATNRAENLHPSVKKPSQFWAWDMLDQQNLSQGFKAGHIIIVVIRIASLLLTIFTFLSEGVLNEYNKDGATASQFTNWTFALFGFQAAMGTFAALQRYLCVGRGYVKDLGYQSQDWSLLDKIFLLSFVTSLSSGIFASIFYWAVLHDGSVTYFDVVKHGGVYTFGLIDLMVSRIPIVSYHHLAVAIYATVYVAFMWVYNAVEDDPVYDTLDLTKAESLKYYFITPLMLTGSFFLLYLIAGLRELWGRGKFECCTWCPCDTCIPRHGSSADLEARGMEYKVQRNPLNNVPPKQEVALMYYS